MLLIATRTSLFRMWYVDSISGPVGLNACLECSCLALGVLHTLAVNVVINVRRKPTCKTKGCVIGLERNLGPLRWIGVGYPEQTRTNGQWCFQITSGTIRRTQNSTAETFVETANPHKPSQTGDQPADSLEVRLDVKIAITENFVLVVAGDDAGHSISTSRRFVPIDVVLLVFVHSIMFVVSPAAELLLHGAFAGECEASEVSLHCW
jgi:hypothetical protein